jgi:hypothetical protein
MVALFSKENVGLTYPINRIADPIERLFLRLAGDPL